MKPQTHLHIITRGLGKITKRAPRNLPNKTFIRFLDQEMPFLCPKKNGIYLIFNRMFILKKDEGMPLIKEKVLANQPLLEDHILFIKFPKPKF